MKILILNCGSSSIKFQLFDMAKKQPLSEGAIEKVGMKGSFLKLKKANGDKVKFEGDILDHESGIEYILGVLTSDKHGCIKKLNEIQAVGHRVVHGGEHFSGSVFISPEIIKTLEDNTELAPLHNPANLKGIHAVKSLMGDIPQVGVFDTSFHQSMPAKAFMYAIPYSLYAKYKVRRYGFHGTSHRYVHQRACDILGEDVKTKKIISCHLGNGASIAAIKNGESVDTSMGFTPVEGLMMGTRTGDLDIGALTFIMNKEEIGKETATKLVNKFSGVLGITGLSSDMREVEEAAAKGDERAKLALDMYHYRVQKYIGAYAAAMGGVDILVFTGGIGENGGKTRYEICKDLEFMGIKLKEDQVSLRGKEAVISTDAAKVKVMVVPTDEEFVIAKDTEEIVKNL
jgi:acetate kinase